MANMLNESRNWIPRGNAENNITKKNWKIRLIKHSILKNLMRLSWGINRQYLFFEPKSKAQFKKNTSDNN